jgi:hypothetical protein
MKRNGVTVKSGATFAEALALSVWMRALAGDPGAAKELRESMEGKAAQRAAPPGNNEPVNIRVTYDREDKNDSLKSDIAPELVSDKSTK